MSTLHGLRDQLLAVREQHGRLTPSIVVEDAAEPTHPLHSCFEWDDVVAGHAWRLEQARSLIQSVNVVYKEAGGKAGPRSVRAFQSVSGPDGRTYEPSDEVASDPLMRQMVLQDMEREWKTLKKRYEHFAEFSTMVLADLTERVAS